MTVEMAMKWLGWVRIVIRIMAEWWAATELSTSQLITHMWSGKRKLEKESERAVNKRSIFVTFSRFSFMLDTRNYSQLHFIFSCPALSLLSCTLPSRIRDDDICQRWCMFLSSFIFIISRISYPSDDDEKSTERKRNFRLFCLPRPDFGHFKTSICCWLAIFSLLPVLCSPSLLLSSCILPPRLEPFRRWKFLFLVLDLACRTFCMCYSHFYTLVHESRTKQANCHNFQIHVPPAVLLTSPRNIVK